MPTALLCCPKNNSNSIFDKSNDDDDDDIIDTSDRSDKNAYSLRVTKQKPAAKTRALNCSSSLVIRSQS